MTCNFLANRNKFVPFLYYPRKDMLLRLNNFIHYHGSDGIDGCLLLFLLFHHGYSVNKKRLDDLAIEINKVEGMSVECGWSNALAQGNAAKFSSKVSVKKTGQLRAGKAQTPKKSLSSVKDAMATKRQDYLNEF